MKKKTIGDVLAVVAVLSLICSAGCIDGPTGHELDNWTGMIIFAVVGVVAGLSAIYYQHQD